MGKYDFEVLVDEINKNKENAIQRDKAIIREIRQNKSKVLKYLALAILSFLIIVCVIIVIQFKHKTITTTPYGSYECRGRIIKVCSGSDEARKYIKSIND